MNGTLSMTERAILAKEVQQLFYLAIVPSNLQQQISIQLSALKRQVPAVKKVKIRSSANAEDIVGFDGAGLHDSFGAKVEKSSLRFLITTIFQQLKAVDNPDFSCQVISSGGAATKLKVVPNTVQCAIKASFASLWNVRAIEERTFSRISHKSAFMGLAVVPAYDTGDDDVVANGVIITRAVNFEVFVFFPFPLSHLLILQRLLHIP